MRWRSLRISVVKRLLDASNSAVQDPVRKNIVLEEVPSGAFGGSSGATP
jgi:hypothetical protein